MGKRIKVTVNDSECIVIDDLGDESWSLIFDSPPYDIELCERKDPDLRFEGLRWRNEEHFHLGFKTITIKANAKVVIEYLDSDEQPTPLEKEEKYIRPEEACSFCHETKSNVNHLIEGGYIHFICDRCIDLCSNLLERERRKS